MGITNNFVKCWGDLPFYGTPLWSNLGVSFCRTAPPQIWYPIPSCICNIAILHQTYTPFHKFIITFTTALIMPASQILRPRAEFLHTINTISM